MRAILFALIEVEAHNRSLFKVFLLPDVKEVVDSMNGMMDWSIKPIVVNIYKLCPSSFINFMFVLRDVNEVAHLLAKYCSNLGRSICWDGCTPDWVRERVPLPYFFFLLCFSVLL